MPLITSRGLGLKLAIASAVVLEGDFTRCDGPALPSGTTTWDSSCRSTVTWFRSGSAPAVSWGVSKTNCICLTKWLVYREYRVDKTMADENKRSIGGTAFVRWQVEGRKYIFEGVLAALIMHYLIGSYQAQMNCFHQGKGGSKLPCSHGMA